MAGGGEARNEWLRWLLADLCRHLSCLGEAVVGGSAGATAADRGVRAWVGLGRAWLS